MYNKIFPISVILLLLFSINLTAIYAQDSAQEVEPKKKSNVVLRKKNAGNGKKVSTSVIAIVMAEMGSEKRARLRKLHRCNPQAFRKEIAKIVSKYRAANNKKNLELKKIVKAYNAASDAEKSAIKEKLSDLVRSQFNKKMDANRRSYKKTVKRLEDLKQKINKREKNADLIIKERIKQLTK